MADNLSKLPKLPSAAELERLRMADPDDPLLALIDELAGALERAQEWAANFPLAGKIASVADRQAADAIYRNSNALLARVKPKGGSDAAESE
jgi:hypothetical protein